MQFDDIFAAYYTLYRGQAQSIPTSGQPEYAIGMQLANTAIRKWDRTDGTMWNELWTTAQQDADGDLVYSVGTTTFAAPADMRKPPAFIRIAALDGTGAYNDFKVIKPYQAELYSGLSITPYFTGSANTGFTLHIDNAQANLDGLPIDYVYPRKPTMMTGGDSVPDMSDPNYMIQDMLASRFMNARNSFGYKTAIGERDAALLNMKIENDSGTYGNAINLLDGSRQNGFGRERMNDSII